MLDHEMNMSGGLHLARKVGQAFYLFVEGIAIRVEITEARGSQCRLRIIAPKEKVVIRRFEQMEKAWDDGL